MCVEVVRRGRAVPPNVPSVFHGAPQRFGISPDQAQRKENRIRQEEREFRNTVTAFFAKHSAEMPVHRREKAAHSITIRCRCVRVTGGGFNAWPHRPDSTHARADRRLNVLVRASFEGERTAR